MPEKERKHTHQPLESTSLPLQMALKCADLGHLAREEAVHIEWVGRLEEEVSGLGSRGGGEGPSVDSLDCKQS